MASEETLASKSITLKKDSMSSEASYDAVLTRTTVGDLLYKLTLKLRLCMQQINPTTTMPATTMDSEDKPFWIVPWTSTTWDKFLAEVQRQANLWNDRFWLKTPSDVTDYDFKSLPKLNSIKSLQDTKYWMPDINRPYIKCYLNVTFVPDPRYAHATIEIANLNTNKKLNPNEFRADSVLWCSQSVDPRVFLYPTETGVWLPHFSATIAHELGHRLGLLHIGVLKKTLLCEYAIELQRVQTDWLRAWHVHAASGN